MGDVCGLWFMEEASGGSHPYDSTEMGFWHPDELGDVFEGNAALKWYTCEDLELAQPTYAGE